jgi:hypothetical protein
VRVLLVLLLLVAACQSPRERSIRRFVQGEILSEELQFQADAYVARQAAAEKCGGPVVLLAYQDGQKPADYLCMPPPASH